MYKITIYTTLGNCREFRVRDYNHALKRIEHYKNHWSFYKFHTLVMFNGVCWIEV